MFLLFTVILVVSFYYAYDITLKWLYARQFDHFPGPPPYTSFLQGNGRTLGKVKKDNAFLECFCSWVEDYGETFQFRIRTRPVIFTIDPDALKTIFSDVVNLKKVDHLPNRALFGQKITGYKSILTGNGQSWAVKRKVVSGFFAKQNMSSLFPHMAPLMDRLLETKIKPRVNTGAPIDIHELMTIIFSALPGVLGISCPMGVDEPEEIGKRVNVILDVIPVQFKNIFKMYGERAMNKEMTDSLEMIFNMRLMCREMVEEKRKEMSGWDGNPDDDMLAWLITANDAAGLTDEEVIDDIMTVYMVSDNMSKQLSGLYTYMVNNQEIFEKMISELRENPITDLKSLDNLKYTEMVILESLRLTPTLLKGTRWVLQDTKLGGYHVPKECQLQWSQYCLHRNEKYWPNARKFDPERFRNGIPNVDTLTYIPFLAGPRACLGKHIAMISMKLTLSLLARNFDQAPQPMSGVPPEVIQNLALIRMKGGPFYYFTPRR